MAEKTTMMALAELIEDSELYPRHAVDDANVRSLTLALEAGCVLPPIVADANSKAIIDGWHRCRAYKRHRGPEATVPVVLRTYKTKGEMVEAAVQLNAAHGRRLDVIDQTRAVLMLEKYGAQPKRIAVVLHCTEERVQRLRIRVATAARITSSTVPGTRSVPLKVSARHLAGTTLTAAQATAHRSMPGNSLTLAAKQIRTAIESKLLNLDDEALMAELQLLLPVLTRLLG